MTTRKPVGILSNMVAELVEDDRLYFGDGSFADVTIWKVTQPVRGSSHNYKYRFAFVYRDQCVLRYDNEAGKGDHKHIGDQEFPVKFVDLDTLRNAFLDDITWWRSKR